MRIGITGASGLGKTTLANELGNSLGIPVFEESFADIINSLHYLHKSKTIESAQKYLEECINWIENRKTITLNKESFICDRVGFDIMSRIILSDLLIDNKNINLLNLIKEMCIQDSARMNLIVVMPFTESALHSGKNENELNRETSLSKKIKSQSLIIGLLEQYSACKVCLIPTEYETVSERKKFILEKLND